MVNLSKIDPFLRLEDAKGEQLAFDDDSGGQLNSRIIFKAPADGEYRIIATCYPDPKTGEPTGKYVVTVEMINWKAYLASRAKALADKSGDIGIEDAKLALSMANGLENNSKELAPAAYTELGKALAGAKETQIADLGKVMEGAGRRLTLMGNPIVVHGQTLEGKEFHWKDYKGKVVLVDFWATWCPPCKQEIPNIKKQYEAYNKAGFEVVAISLDQAAKGKKEAAEYMATHKLPWTCLFDEEPGKDRQPMSKYYGVFGIPLAILVDREGNVVSMQARGPELERLLKKYLEPTDKGGDKESK
jgi:thiol-disulfide isomerase/thioredoxin